MNKFYERFLSGTELWETDQYNFLTTYFEHEAAITAFVIALIVAAVLMILFYGVFGMKFPKLGENRWVWVICLVASFLITWVATDAVVIGSDVPLSGVFQSIDNQMPDVLENAGSDPEAIEAANIAKDTMYQELKDYCSFRMTLDLMNSLIGLLLFLLGSIVAKRFTKYSQNVPF